MAPQSATLGQLHFASHPESGYIFTQKGKIAMRENKNYSFQEWFSSEYLKRTQKNPRFSIRAFAKCFDMDPSSISQLLSGKRNPSPKMVSKICNTLKINEEETKYLVGQTRLTKHNNTSFKKNETTYFEISQDIYEAMSSWYHIAILELTCTKDFQYDSQWIGKKLDISTQDAKMALKRLIRLGLLENINGKIKKTNTFLTNENKIKTSIAHKKMQKDILKKGIEAIDKTPQNEKDITAITMAIDPSKLEEAKILIKDFRRNLSEFLENGNQTQVYNMAIQLYPISKRQE